MTRTKIPRVIRAFMFLFVAPLVLAFFAVGALLEWILGRVRR